jgi:RNA 3'-terminal phosphate cyclase (ATP)
MALGLSLARRAEAGFSATKAMITIDGSRHSGSGTILRYAVALATLMGSPLQMTDIRVKRPKPGLRRQHLGALMACARVCSGTVEGAEVGSREIVYRPGPAVQPGTYAFDVGSAGSTTLLSFALTIPALFSYGPVSVTVIGGLFQDFAPTAYHMKHCLLPLLARMGAQVFLDVDKPGYVPKGQGRLIVRIHPVTAPLKPLLLPEQGEACEVRGIALASHLAGQHVARRMAQACTQILQESGLRPTVEVVQDTSAAQPGAALAVWTETETGAMLGADMAGAHGRPSEKIGRSVARSLLQDLGTGATVDRHLADQLIVFAALAEGTTAYRIPAVTDHVESNLWLVQEILGAHADVQDNVVTVKGICHHPTSSQPDRTGRPV